MPFVLDGSVTLAWILPDEASTEADAWRDTLATDSAIVPGHWALEVANGLLAAARRRQLVERDVSGLLRTLSSLPIDTDAGTTAAAWTATLALARRHRLTLYDAAYLELARRLSLPLATIDSDLRSACRSARVRTTVARA